MTEEQTRYPLSWPANWPRTPRSQRKRARFKSTTRKYSQTSPGSSWLQSQSLTVAQALERLQAEVDRLGARGALVSSNVAVRLDGLPRSGQAEPQDPGVALYFTLKRAPRCLACDRWDRVADNIAALASHIEAIRSIDRWGVGTLEQAFAGYVGLPPKSDAWALLGVERGATEEQINDAFRAKARTAHPDAGGDHDTMSRLSAARDEALAAARAMRR